MSLIQKELDRLEESTVKNIHFDVLADKIIFELDLHSVDTMKLVFHKVSSYYFLKNYGEFRFTSNEPDPGDYLELTSISFSQEGFGKFLFESKVFGLCDPKYGGKKLEPLYSSANFALELWASSLFIEAQGVSIGDDFFEVGVPKKYNY